MKMKNVTQQEVENIKLLLSKGLTRPEVCKITGRSFDTIRRVVEGAYDKKEKEEINLEVLYNHLWAALEIIDKFREKNK